MKQFEELQAIFLRWFKHHGTRSMSQISQNIENLCKSYDFDGKGLYPVFYPLVRKGFIEFIGEDRYQIAPPVVLHHQKSGFSTGVNLNKIQTNQIKGKANEYTIDLFGVIRFKLEQKQIESLCNELNCSFSVPNASHIFSNFPRLSGIMMNETPLGFTKNITHEGTGFYLNLKNHKFDENKKNGAVGIFKTDKDAHKYFYCDGTDCYEIPSEKYNPEGRYIAESVQAVKENFDFLSYNERQEQLTVRGINIPVLIDRVLRLPSIHIGNGILEENFKTTYSNITPSVIKQLNRIFETKIRTIHE